MSHSAGCALLLLLLLLLCSTRELLARKPLPWPHHLSTSRGIYELKLTYFSHNFLKKKHNFVKKKKQFCEEKTQNWVRTQNFVSVEWFCNIHSSTGAIRIARNWFCFFLEIFFLYFSAMITGSRSFPNYAVGGRSVHRLFILRGSASSCNSLLFVSSSTMTFYPVSGGVDPYSLSSTFLSSTSSSTFSFIIMDLTLCLLPLQTLSLQMYQVTAQSVSPTHLLLPMWGGDTIKSLSSIFICILFFLRTQINTLKRRWQAWSLKVRVYTIHMFDKKIDNWQLMIVEMSSEFALFQILTASASINCSSNSVQLVWSSSKLTQLASLSLPG